MGLTFVLTIFQGMFNWCVCSPRYCAPHLPAGCCRTGSGDPRVGGSWLPPPQPPCCSMTVQPVMAAERTVFYRERAASYYSPVPYAMVRDGRLPWGCDGGLSREAHVRMPLTSPSQFARASATTDPSRSRALVTLVQATGVVELPYLLVQAILMVLVTT